MAVLHSVFPTDAGYDIMPEDEGYFVYVIFTGDLSAQRRGELEGLIPADWYPAWSNPETERSGYTICSILKK